MCAGAHTGAGEIIMPQLATPSHVIVTQQPAIEIYIDGKRQRQAKLTSLSDAAGIEPALCTLLYPLRDYKEYPCSENDQVIIYVNRVNRPEPLFRGYVTGFGAYKTLEEGEYIQVFAADDLVKLNDGCVNRNYNIKTTDDEFSIDHGRTEVMDIKAIAADIYTQIRADFSSYPYIDTASFPDDFPGEVNLLGTPYGSAIMQLLDMAGDDKYILARSYTRNQTIIEAVKIGSAGRVGTADIIYATDMTAAASSQPAGLANAQDIRREEQYIDVVNKAVVLGDRKVIETALLLNEAWPSAKESYLTDIELYTKQGSEDDPNPHYDEDAERIGRAYRFPYVNQGRFWEKPELMPHNLVQPPWAYSGSTQDFMQPYIVYKYGSEATWNVTWDISISDNEVMAKKPLARNRITGGASINPELPSSVYLEAAFRLRSPLAITISKQGSVNRTITRYFMKPEFEYQYRSGYFSVSTVVGATTDRYYATYNAGTDIVKNDTGTATTWGQDRVRTTRDKRLEITYTLPRFDLNYRVGQALRENGESLEASIVRIDYDFVNNVTVVQAMSR